MIFFFELKISFSLWISQFKTLTYLKDIINFYIIYV